MATAEFRTTDYLDSPETIAAYLKMAMEDPDPAMLMMALRNIAEEPRPYQFSDHIL